MQKTSSMAVMTAFFLTFLLAPDVMLSEESKNEALSGWVKEVSDCKSKPAGTLTQTQTMGTEPLVVQSSKKINITVNNMPDKIVLASNFPITAGTTTLYPCDLNQNDFITVIYDANKKAYSSATLEKVKAPRSVKVWAFLTGLIVVGILYLILMRAWKTIKKEEIGGFGALIVGYDNRYSNSKFQMAIWTFLVIFTYVMLYSERLYAAARGFSFVCPINIPDNLLILMGITSTSFVGAKLVTSSKVESGTVSKEPADRPRISDLFSNDAMNIDLGDVQMLAWTVIAALIYFASCIRILLQPVDFVPSMSLPDIDTTLLALTGISQAAYLTKKMATSDVLKIETIEPREKAEKDKNIVIKGAGFGTKIGEVAIGKEKGKEISLEIVAWYDANIEAKIAAADKKTTIEPGKTMLTVKTPQGRTAVCQYEIA